MRVSDRLNVERDAVSPPPDITATAGCTPIRTTRRAGRISLWQALNILRGLALPPFWSIRAVVGAVAYLVPQLRNIYAHVFLQDRTSDDLRESPEVVECAKAEWGQVAFQAMVVALAVRFPAAVLWGYIVPVSIAGLLAARRVLIEHTTSA